MSSKSFVKNVLIAGLALTAVMAGTACDKKIYSDPNMTATQTALDPLSFKVVDEKLNDYNNSINDFMMNNPDQASQKAASGKTVNGVPAECTYTISNDGKYECLQMMKTLESYTQVDEYFNLEDSIFFVRTTVNNDNTFEPVEKYYIKDGVIYKVDRDTQSVTKLADLNDEASASEIKTQMDIYLSFEEIRELYAG